jgi:hypothetical protein
LSSLEHGWLGRHAKPLYHPLTRQAVEALIAKAQKNGAK